MIMEWLRKKAVDEIWDEKKFEKKQDGALEDEIRLLNHVIVQNDSMMQDFLNQRDRAQKAEREAEKTVKALMADLEAEKAQNEKWENWSHGAIEKIMIYEERMSEATKGKLSALMKYAKK